MRLLRLIAKRRPARDDEKGTILIVTLLVLLVISSIGVGVLVVAGGEIDLAANVRSGEQAVYYADAGIQEALRSFDAAEGVGALPSGFNTVKQQIVPLSGTYAPVYRPDGTVVPEAGYRVEGEMDVAMNGFSVICNIPGFSLDYGQRRYHLISTGVGPGGATRSVEAVIFSKPMPGLCPPGLGELSQ